ncbi:DUF5362 family protein [Lutibacter sp. B1]|uniref:DUF5362 family protein n=1 Tax=Lutibacter sp. B1 TaxID=2725996 RepID=UPI00145678CA|nr:DUF5362 family protein [Lutibacter sp. B1]NLP57296.1 DUF5362 domain-containing protein [Lutibacter sp. B1]
MEDFIEIQDESAENDSTLKLSKKAKTNLSETGKWVYFLSIIGFCFIGLIVIIALFAGTLLSTIGGDESPFPFPGIFISILYLLMGLVYFFPIYYLFNFANNIKKAIEKKDSESLDKALENLKSHYKFVGILTIIMLAFYVLFGLGAFLF